MHKKNSSVNVLLITLDTTRADHLGCYGYTQAATPSIDRLSREGTLFEQAFSHVPITLPSHATIMTGVYPKEHGVRDNGRSRLGKELKTMAEIFQEHGYRTGAFLGAMVLGSQFGLARGFEFYDDDMVSAKSEGTRFFKDRPGNIVVDSALAWLHERKDDPFFCWVHLFDPHAPYEPPSGFRKKDVHPYDGEIAFVDHQIKRMFGWLDSKGLKENTLIVLTADHGEGLWEHGEFSHTMFLYNTTLHVPLIFSLPGKIFKNHRVKATVGLVDLFPTILEFMGWKIPDQASGRSLGLAFSGKELKDLPCYAETEYPYLAYGWSDLRSLTTWKWKYIRAPKPELYDRQSDPKELVNLVGEHSEVADKLNSELRTMERNMVSRRGETMQLDQRSREALKSLGYLQGGNVLSETGEPIDIMNRKDPKDMLKVVEEYEKSMQLLRDEKVEQALMSFEKLALRNPESPLVRNALGLVYLRMEKNQEAMQEFKAALSLDPNNCETNINLGLTLMKEKNVKEAIAHLQPALDHCPGHLDAFVSLGDAWSAQGKLKEASESFKEAIKADPDLLQAHLKLGSVLFRQNLFEEAISEFEYALNLHPKDVIVMFNIFSAYTKLGRNDAAVEELNRILSIDPGNQKAKALLKRFQANQGM